MIPPRTTEQDISYSLLSTISRRHEERTLQWRFCFMFSTIHDVHVYMENMFLSVGAFWHQAFFTGHGIQQRCTLDYASILGASSLAEGYARMHGGLGHFWAGGLRHFAWNSLGAYLDENLRLADNWHTPFLDLSFRRLDFLALVNISGFVRAICQKWFLRFLDTLHLGWRRQRLHSHTQSKLFSYICTWTSRSEQFSHA